MMVNKSLALIVSIACILLVGVASTIASTGPCCPPSCRRLSEKNEKLFPDDDARHLMAEHRVRALPQLGCFCPSQGEVASPAECPECNDPTPDVS